MDTRRHFCTRSLGLGLALLVPWSSHAQIAVTDAANLAKNILTSIQTAKSNINEALIIEQQIRSYVQQAKHLTRIPVTLLQQIQGAFTDYRQILSRAEGIGFQLQEAQRQFEALYGQGAALAQTDFTTLATRWGTQMQATTKTAIEAQAVATQLQRTQAQMELALSQSDRAEGSLQAQQSTNQLLAMLTQQQAALLELQAATTRAETEFYSQWNAGEAKARLETERWLRRDPTAMPAYRPPGQTSGGLPMPKLH